jgi:hypothetical protein
MTSDQIEHLVRLDRVTMLSDLFRMGTAESFEFLKETKFEGETIRARISSPTTLGAAEQDVLYSLSSIALKKMKYHNNENMIFQISYSSILHEMNKKSDSSKEYDRIRKSIQALSSVIVTLEREKTGKKYVAFSKKLMIESEGDLEGNLKIKLHPLLSAAITGQNYIGVDVRERMSLGETARVLHSGLCARINRGSSSKSKVGNLMKMIFGDESITVRRKNQFNRARIELIGRGWKIDIKSRGESTQPDDIAVIHRPK